MSAEQDFLQRLHSSLHIVSMRDLFLMCDHPNYTQYDLVMNPGSNSSHALAELTTRKPIESALDIGTGSGLQAFLAARHATRVVATDVNSRALAFARINSVVNGVDNVEFRLGSMFECIPTHETFDLIVCNPPFVISPKYEFTYRDSGRYPGWFVEAFMSEVVSRLNDGGVCHILNHVVHRPGFQGLPLWDLECDVDVSVQNTKSVEEYITKWATHDKADWHAYFARENITAVSFVSIKLVK